MWLKPQGFAEVVSPDGGRINLDRFQCDELRAGTNRYDSMTCNHCNRITHIKPKMDPAEMGGLCKICMKLICKYCLDQGCLPFEKKLEMIEKKEIALRSYGM